MSECVSQLFAPFRALGLITGDVPFLINRRGTENFVTLACEKSFQILNCAKLHLLFVSKEHEHRITGLAQCGNIIVTASGHTSVLRLWDRGQLVGCLEGHTGPVDILCTVGNTLLTVGSDRGGRTLRIWDIEHHNAVGSLPQFPKEQRVTCICHPDTYLNKVVVGFADGHMQLWNFNTKKLIYTFKGNWDGTAITCISQSPVVDVVAVGLADGRIVLHNLRADKTLFTVTHAGASVTSATFRTDGVPIMATGSARGGIAIWNLERRELIGMIPDAHEQARIIGLQFLEGEPVLISTGADNSVRMWIFDNSGDAGAARLLRGRSGHAKPPRQIAYYGDDARIILSCGEDRAFRLFSVVRDQQSVEFSQGKGMVKKARKRHTDTQHFKLPPVIAFSAWPVRAREWDNIVTAHEGSSTAYTWNYVNKALGSLELPSSEPHPAPLTCVTLSACGNFAFTGSQSGWIDKFNVQSGLHRGTCRHSAHKAEITGLAADSTNTVLVSSSLDGSLCFHDFDTLEVKARIQPGDGLPITRMCFNRDNNLVAVVTDDGCIRVYDAVSPEHRLARRFDGHSEPVTAILFTDDGRWLISASVDCTVRVWDMAAGRMIDWFSSKRPVTSMTMSPSGDFLATAHAGRRGIFLWANKTFFSSVLLHAPPPLPGFMDLPGRVGPALVSGSEEDAMLDDDEHPALQEDLLFDNVNCPAGMVTLTGLAAGKWQNIDSLEEIRERNKPTEVKQKVEVPFFIPIVQGLQPHFDASAQPAPNTSATDDGDGDGEGEDQDGNGSEEVFSRVLGKRSGNSDDFLSSQLYAALEQFEEDGDSDNVAQFLLSLAPSAVDFEIRSLPQSEDGKALALMMDVFTQQLDAQHRSNFDVMQTYIRLFLKIHGETLIRQGSYLREHILALEKAQKEVWEGIESLVNTNLCMLNYTTGIRM